MLPLERHFDPLRPNRLLMKPEKYEFTHGTNSVCVYDMHTLDFIREIPVGPRPDCHSTSMDNRYLYIACEDGLYCIDQQVLEVVKKLDTGHVYGTNVMPDGTTMFLHDASGGILVLKDIQDMNRIHISKRIDVLGTNTPFDTLGGKGHFICEGKYYLCCGWNWPNLYIIDMHSGYNSSIFIKDDPMLKLSDDLVVSRDKTKAYCACYSSREDSYVAVVELKSRTITGKIKTGTGTCGLTMSNDEQYVIASNDGDDSISVIDTITDEVVSTVSARAGFEKLGITGYIQGISVGQQDEIYVYGCSGNGALVKFWDILGKGKWMISSPVGKCTK